MDVEKLERIKELKEQRKKLDDEIAALTAEVTAEFNSALNGDRKPRKPRAPKQLELPR